jgi:hypothetical protein
VPVAPLQQASNPLAATNQIGDEDALSSLTTLWHLHSISKKGRIACINRRDEPRRFKVATTSHDA